MNSRFFIGLIFLFLLTLGFFLTLDIDYTSFNFPEKKLWAHRSNSPKAIQNSISSGVIGFEIDVWLHNNDLLVAHEQSELDNRRPLEFLVGFLANRSPRFFLWIDFKNLSLTNYSKVRLLLEELLDKYQLHDRVLIESKNPLALSFLCHGPISCILWTYKKSNPISSFALHLARQVSLVFSNIALQSYDVKDIENFKEINKSSALFTVNNFKQLNELMENTNAKIILTDNFSK